MNTVLFNKIYALKVNEKKAKINLKYEEQNAFAQELNKVLGQLSLTEIKELKTATKAKYAKTTTLLQKCKRLNQKFAAAHRVLSSFDAKTFYDLSAKELACKELIADCKQFENKLKHNDLQF